MAGFVGRTIELDLLVKALRSPRSEFIPIYGRRSVGKSELILRFLDGRPAVYFLGRQAPESLQIREFLGEAARALGLPLLANLRVSGWGEAVLTVVQQWAAAQPGAKLILALDEFQWMAGASPGLVADLQRCWDRHWKAAGNVFLILCGSYPGFMGRTVLGAKSPLFGRRTAQIHLQPFGYREASLFHPRWSLADRAKAYLLVGGLPQYLLCLNDSRSVEQNIRDHLLDEFAPLFHEPTFLLREELRELAPYQAVLFAVASGRATAGEIARTTQLSERNVPYYLQQLVELGYLARRYPLDGRRPNRKALRFAMDDPLLRFWFRFVFPNLSLIRSGGPRLAFAERIAPSLDAWFGGGFERLCREALPLLYASEGVAAGFQVGEFWSSETRIDVVGLREDGWTDLGECKWGAVRSPRALESELEGKVSGYPNTRGASLGRRHFVRKKPRSRQDADGWHSLEDLYALRVV